MKPNITTTSFNIPKHVHSKNPEFCNCGFNKPVSDNVSRLCNHNLCSMIKENIEKCVVTKYESIVQ